MFIKAHTIFVVVVLWQKKAEEASEQANFSCSLRGWLRMLNTNSTCIFKYYTHREGIYSLLL